jgi:hypothetical protein
MKKARPLAVRAPNSVAAAAATTAVHPQRPPFLLHTQHNTHHTRQKERERTHLAATTGAEEAARFAVLAAEQARKLREEQAAERAKLAADKRLTWNAKEKRKRDAGMQSRGKNYVEEEKRCVACVCVLRALCCVGWRCVC